MASNEAENSKSTNPALDPDNPNPDIPGLEFAQFGAGCFWGVELAFQRVAGVVKTEAGYSQGHVDNPDYKMGGDVGEQYRSGIYYYSEEQASLAKESLQVKEKELNGKKIVTEILPSKRFYRAEEYHQQYLEKGGGQGCKQSASKGCNDPIRCYG